MGTTRFLSKKLDSAQVNYSAFDRDLLAAFSAVQHFRFQVEGRPFQLWTDHRPLTFALGRFSDTWTPCQQRQLSYIAEYTSDIVYVPGVDNVVADTLSRPQQVMPSCHRRLACVPGHLRPPSAIIQQVPPSRHRRRACVHGYLQPSSVTTQQVPPSPHRRLACVPGHLQPSSIYCS